MKKAELGLTLILKVCANVSIEGKNTLVPPAGAMFTRLLFGGFTPLNPERLFNWGGLARQNRGSFVRLSSLTLRL